MFLDLFLFIFGEQHFVSVLVVFKVLIKHIYKHIHINSSLLLHQQAHSGSSLCRISLVTITDKTTLKFFSQKIRKTSHLATETNKSIPPNLKSLWICSTRAIVCLNVLVLQICNNKCFQGLINYILFRPFVHNSKNNYYSEIILSPWQLMKISLQHWTNCSVGLWMRPAFQPIAILHNTAHQHTHICCM